ncbi:hypothetical protein CHX26_07150 [Porphyrobacter sp. HT-58-2]|uniref:hypothetical protein n=1 Tax=Porphyrobacter sp. HT-58-2 TaxID=2023229 RepID=UPI000CDC7B5D|nr:hypothetical protein [Porphyrobacter sp. HT-58-2]AUX69301.1 hypothetical protein CHX26_07150 [Porphyrobacter sp. HT-58-2]
MIGDDDFLREGQARAVCIACGDLKHEPFHRCEACELDPKGPDLVKATYLSVYRFADDRAAAARYADELPAIGKAIAGGAPALYDADELARLEGWIDATVSAGSKSVIRIVLFAALVLAALVAAWAILGNG